LTHSRYVPHETLVGPARNGRETLGWLIVGLLFSILTTWFLSLVFYSAAEAYFASRGRGNFIEELIDGSTPEAMITLLFSFGVWIAVLYVSVPFFYKRHISTVLGATVLRDLLRTLLALFILNISIVILPPWDLAADANAGLPLSRWLLLLPLSLLGILIQVSAEEILFRGYLQQQLSARFSSPLIWIGLPSVLFGLLHYSGTAGSNAWTLVLWSCIFGALMADLTARTGSLGPAIGVHFINNCLAMLIVGLPGTLDGLALYTYPFGMQNEAAIRAYLPIDFALMLVSWLMVRLAFRC